MYLAHAQVHFKSELVVVKFEFFVFTQRDQIGLVSWMPSTLNRVQAILDLFCGVQEPFPVKILNTIIGHLVQECESDNQSIQNIHNHFYRFLYNQTLQSR